MFCFCPELLRITLATFVRKTFKASGIPESMEIPFTFIHVMTPLDGSNLFQWKQVHIREKRNHSLVDRAPLMSFSHVIGFDFPMLLVLIRTAMYFLPYLKLSHSRVWWTSWFREWCFLYFPLPIWLKNEENNLINSECQQRSCIFFKHVFLWSGEILT